MATAGMPLPPIRLRTLGEEVGHGVVESWYHAFTIERIIGTKTSGRLRITRPPYIDPPAPWPYDPYQSRSATEVPLGLNLHRRPVLRRRRDLNGEVRSERIGFIGIDPRLSKGVVEADVRQETRVLPPAWLKVVHFIRQRHTAKSVRFYIGSERAEQRDVTRAVRGLVPTMRTSTPSTNS